MQHCFTIDTKEDVRMAVYGDDFVCLSDDDDSNTSTVFSNPNTQQTTWDHLDSEIQTCKVCCCCIVCLELGLIKLDSI